MGLDMFKFMNVISKIGDAINRIIDDYGREYLIDKYNDGGLHLKLIVEDIDFEVVLRPAIKVIPEFKEG